MARIKNNSLSIYLKELRNNAGLDQIEVGEVIGKSRQTISAYENGTATPSISVLSQLAAVYDVDITALTSKIPRGNSINNFDLGENSVFSNSKNNSHKYKYLDDSERLLLLHFEQMSLSDRKKLIEIAKILGNSSTYE